MAEYYTFLTFDLLLEGERGGGESEVRLLGSGTVNMVTFSELVEKVQVFCFFVLDPIVYTELNHACIPNIHLFVSVS